MAEQRITEKRWVTLRPGWVNGDSENIAVVPAAEYDRLRSTLETVAVALPVLQNMCKAAGLHLGERKAREMQEWVAEALGSRDTRPAERQEAAIADDDGDEL